MKKVKTMVSIFLTIIFMLAICAPVFAEEVQTGRLTIRNTKEEETYTLYKVFNLTYAPGTNGAEEGYHAYTIHSAFADFFTDEKLENFEGDTKDLKAIAYVESREHDLAEFATELQQYIIAQSIAATKMVAGQEESTVVEELEYGYYLMVPTDGLTTDGLSALFSLNTVKPNAEINNKSQYPTIEKAIVENGAAVDSNTVAMGDVVNYQVTSSVSSLAGYSSYTFYIQDTFGPGLTFCNDVTIQLKKGDAKKDLVKDTDFTVIQEGQTVTIAFTNFIQYKSTTWQGADVIISYSALVNEHAVVGAAGNVNTAALTYSSNPAVPDETKTTTMEIVSSYIAGVTINKIDGNGNALTGAQFQLAGDKVNQVRVQGTELQTQTESFSVNAFVDVNGQLVLEGLTEGEYQIKELIAPTGYHLLEQPITIIITCEKPEKVLNGTETCIWTVELTNPNDENITPAVVDGMITLAVTNQAGNALPFTGGMGTTLFIVGGSFVMIGALLSLIWINRRKTLQKR